MNWYNFNQNPNKILCAKDISSDGSQFAIYPNGKFAVLTVFRESVSASADNPLECFHASLA